MELILIGPDLFLLLEVFGATQLLCGALASCSGRLDLVHRVIADGVKKGIEETDDNSDQH